MTLPEDTLAVMREINKKYGSDTVVLGSDMAVAGRFTTGSLGLDVALGGGLPANQWCEILGLESAGKTAMALKTIAANQRLSPDYTAFWLAAERYDETQAAALGVDNERVLVAPTQEMEKAFDLLIKTVESQSVTGIYLDSYPALIAEDEREKDMDEPSVAVGARLFNKFLRKAGRASHRDVRGGDPPFHGVIINQYRDKIGGFAGFGGPPKTSPGGNGKNYFFFARIEVARLAWIKENRPGVKEPVKVGQQIRFTTIKNKSASPQQRADVDYYFRGAPFLGFRRGDYNLGKEYVEMGKLLQVIRGSTWLEYRGESFRRGKLEARILEDLDFRFQLREDVLEVARNPELVDQITEEEYARAKA